ncbi:MAG TPA: VWA domain-containing protein [Prolixibacteraceae bacterium]|nr:VWA domain-containing protein [Prolixibacteraceae bacterium]HPT31822.1 VWA domain-containing protein [Prolixibacteraceae bacterium]
MEPKHKIFNLIILDESGSMQSIKHATIGGFNEVVQTVKGVEKQFPEQEHFISLVTFNGMGIKTLLENEPVAKLDQIDEKKYQPESMTPLFDAMGFSLIRLKKEVENYTDYNVLVTILTDGEENASREYDGEAIKKLIEELSLKNWTFTYIGANQNEVDFAMKISITNTMSFQANAADMKKMFEREKKARINYSQNIREKKDFKTKFYFEEDDDENKV